MSSAIKLCTYTAKSFLLQATIYVEVRMIFFQLNNKLCNVIVKIIRLSLSLKFQPLKKQQSKKTILQQTFFKNFCLLIQVKSNKRKGDKDLSSTNPFPKQLQLCGLVHIKARRNSIQDLHGVAEAQALEPSSASLPSASGRELEQKRDKNSNWSYNTGCWQHKLLLSLWATVPRRTVLREKFRKAVLQFCLVWIFIPYSFFIR